MREERPAVNGKDFRRRDASDLSAVVCAQVFLRAGSGRHGKGKGRKIGRPQATLDDVPANFLRHYPQYKNGAFNLTELARLCDISRTTAYKHIGLLAR